MLRYFCFFTVILGVRSALAPFIKPCKAQDNDCILQSAQAVVPYLAAGIPALGVSSLDPIHFDEIKSNQGGLELLFKDISVTGLKDCKVEAIKQDLSKGKQQVIIRCTVDLNGKYKLNGQLLVFPIQGEGKCNIKIRDIVIKSTTELETVNGADGKPHWHIKSRKHSYQVKTDAKFKFENLFNGNKVLSDPVEEFINTNWQDVMSETASPIVKAIVNKGVDIVGELYKAVPIAELIN